MSKKKRCEVFVEGYEPKTLARFRASDGGRTVTLGAGEWPCGHRKPLVVGAAAG